jgi:hypothetical protein
MNMTWGRVLVGGAVAMCLLGVGVLEVLSARAPIGRVLSAPPRPAEVRPEPWLEGNDAALLPGAEGEMSGPDDARGLTAAVQQRRLTVLEVNERAGRLVSLNAAGRVLVTELDHNPFVVTKDSGAGSLALLKPGDVVRIDQTNGKAQRIVVLRHGWQEMESPEK